MLDLDIKSSHCGHEIRKKTLEFYGFHQLLGLFLG
jgi:hypothetical protein